MKEFVEAKGVELRISENVLQEVEKLLAGAAAKTDAAGAQWYGPLKTFTHLSVVVYARMPASPPADAIKLPAQFGAAYLIHN